MNLEVRAKGPTPPATEGASDSAVKGAGLLPFRILRKRAGSGKFDALPVFGGSGEDSVRIGGRVGGQVRDPALHKTGMCRLL